MADQLLPPFFAFSSLNMGFGFVISSFGICGIHCLVLVHVVFDFPGT